MANIDYSDSSYDYDNHVWTYHDLDSGYYVDVRDL